MGEKTTQQATLSNSFDFLRTINFNVVRKVAINLIQIISSFISLLGASDNSLNPEFVFRLIKGQQIPSTKNKSKFDKKISVGANQLIIYRLFENSICIIGPELFAKRTKTKLKFKDMFKIRNLVKTGIHSRKTIGLCTQTQSNVE